MVESWKDIKNYEGLYQISDLGKVKNIKTNKIKKPSVGNTGYEYVYLYKYNHKSTFTIHRLVAETFIPNPDNKEQVNHIDGNKKNNCISNLEWVTPKENVRHSIYILGNKPVSNTRGKFGRDSKRSKKIGQYDMSGNLIGIYYGGREIQRKLNLSTCSHILEVIKGVRKSAFGFYWKEVD